MSYDENTSLSTPSILDPAIKVMTNAWTSLKSPIKSLLRLEKREAHGVEIMLFYDTLCWDEVHLGLKQVCGYYILSLSKFWDQ